MKRTVAQQETLVNHQDTARIKLFPSSEVSSKETRGAPNPVDSIKLLAAWTLKKRKAEGLTLDEVSDAIGKSQMSKIENGKMKSIPLDTLYALAKGLNTSIDEPLRAMGYFERDSVVVQGELGHFLGAFQELPEDWRMVIEELTIVLHRKLQKGRKGGGGSL